VTAALAPILLAGCGGGSDGSMVSSGASAAKLADTSSGTSSVSLSPLSSTVASTLVRPAFYTAPVVLNPPSDIDSAAPFASAKQRPAAQASTSAMAAGSLSRLTPQTIARRATSTTQAAASSTQVTTYTPAQIRAAYQLPPLPSSWSNLSASEAAQMGAGQTIYLIDAMSDPNVVKELAAFNQKFGLPGCTTTTIAPNASLPLAAPGSNVCQFSVVSSTTSGAMHVDRAAIRLGLGHRNRARRAVGPRYRAARAHRADPGAGCVDQQPGRGGQPRERDGARRRVHELRRP
jgi:hypothetical protein